MLKKEKFSVQNRCWPSKIWIYIINHQRENQVTLTMIIFLWTLGTLQASSVDDSLLTRGVNIQGKYGIPKLLKISHFRKWSLNSCHNHANPIWMNSWCVSSNYIYLFVEKVSFRTTEMAACVNKFTSKYKNLELFIGLRLFIRANLKLIIIDIIYSTNSKFCQRKQR